MKLENILAIFMCIITLFGGAINIGIAAGKKHPESYYQKKWCNGRGQMEVILSDRTRCDCLMPDYAVEIEFGRNWAEAIGQSLHYARMTGRQAGIVLIVDNQRYLDRLNGVIEHHKLPITVWEIKP